MRQRILTAHFATHRRQFRPDFTSWQHHPTPEHIMTIPENKEIPAQPAAAEAAIPDQALSDTNLDEITGGATDFEDWPPCMTEEELEQEKELAAVEGSIRLDAGSDVPVIEK
jgi:hypothetical protein